MQKYFDNNKKCIKKKTGTKLEERKGCSNHKSGAKKDADLNTSFLVLYHIQFSWKKIVIKFTLLLHVILK